jgi:hypothetical protein
MITADMVRDLIVDHDASRPRSQQTAIGPSDLSSPCDRKLIHQILGTPKAVDPAVNLAAWVGTALHAQMEAALKGNPDWLTEQKVGVKLSKTLTIAGHLDAYHKPSKTIVDWKSVGPSALAKYRRATPDNYRTQVSVYGLLAVLSGRMSVENTAIVFIPRNGDMADIHVDCHPWDQDRADNAIRRLEALHAAAAAGPVVLPLVGTADDCRFCGWWNPNAWADGNGCPGHQTPGDVPVETQPNTTQKETTP